MHHQSHHHQFEASIEHNQPVEHHAVAHPADHSATPISEDKKVSSEEFTKGKFDSSETLAQGHHNAHKKHHLKHPQTISQKEKTPEQEEQEFEAEEANEQAAANQAKFIKTQMETQARHNAEYQMRLSSANQFDGLVHLPDGQKQFVDDGSIVNGANLYSQQKHHHQAKHHVGGHHAKTAGHAPAHHQHKKVHATHGHKHHAAPVSVSSNHHMVAHAQSHKGAVKHHGGHKAHVHHVAKHAPKAHHEKKMHQKKQEVEVPKVEQKKEDI